MFSQSSMQWLDSLVFDRNKQEFNVDILHKGVAAGLSLPAMFSVFFVLGCLLAFHVCWLQTKKKHEKSQKMKEKKNKLYPRVFFWLKTHQKNAYKQSTHNHTTTTIINEMMYVCMYVCVLAFNLSHFGVRMIAWTLIKHFKVMMGHYPWRCMRVYVINAPKWFHLVFDQIKKIFPAHAAQKVNINTHTHNLF